MDTLGINDLIGRKFEKLEQMYILDVQDDIIDDWQCFSSLKEIKKISEIYRENFRVVLGKIGKLWK